MFGISHLFQKIQNAFAKDLTIRGIVCEAVLKHVGVALPPGSISFKSDTLVLNNVNQSMRSAIYIKKPAIIKEIADKQKARTINDIR